MNTASAELSRYTDRLALSVIRDSDAFYAAPLFYKRVWALGCLLHHAGSNGLQALLDYAHADGPTILLASIEALQEIGASDLHSAAHSYWSKITFEAARGGIMIPASVSEGSREEFHGIYRFWIKEWGLYRLAQKEGAQFSDAFISCGETDFPTLCMKWIDAENTK